VAAVRVGAAEEGRSILLPVVVISHAPSRELYEQVAAGAHVDTDRPPGAIIHTASELPDGRVRIVDVWESREHAAGFERTRLVPALVAICAPGGPPEREITETFHLIR
jgi:hypothetical protein